MATIKPLPWKEIIKNYTLATLYLFVLTLVGALAVLVYNHFFPVDVASEMSVLAVALIFGAVVFIDRSTAAKVKKYIPPRVITGSFTVG